MINLSRDLDKSKAFHVLGLDVLIDKKFNAWLMEINSNPSLNIFLERDIPGAIEGATEKILQELDKHVKAQVVTEAIRIVTGEGDGEYDGVFEKLLPVEDGSMDEFYVWNKGQEFYDLLLQTKDAKKEPNMEHRLSLFQFSRLNKVPDFGKQGSFFKADLEIVFKNL